MKLLIVGSEEICSLERWYASHLEELGVSVQFFPAQSIFYNYYRSSIKNKLAFKLGISSIYNKIDALIREKVIATNPEFILIFKGMEVKPSFLAWVRERGIKVVNYNPDSPFLFSGSGSGNKNVTNSIGLYDLHLTYDREIQERIEKEFHIPCQLLPFGFELTDAVYEQCILQEEVNCLCFLGNPDKGRITFIQQLANTVPVHVYGHNWKKHIDHSNVTVFNPVIDDEFWKVLYRYRVQLNLMRPHNPSSHNMRSFEVPGVGGIGLFPDTPDHRTYFTDKKDIFLFKDFKECVNLAQHLLQLSKAGANVIRQNARQYSVVSGYHYKDRARTIVQYFQSLYEGNKGHTTSTYSSIHANYES